jgi:hypothetical protein
MIIELLFNLLFSVVNILFLPFDGLNLIISSDIFSTVIDYCSVALYVLPIQNFIPIIAFVISTMVLRILIAALKTLWDILPIV